MGHRQRAISSYRLPRMGHVASASRHANSRGSAHFDGRSCNSNAAHDSPRNEKVRAFILFSLRAVTQRQTMFARSTTR